MKQRSTSSLEWWGFLLVWMLATTVVATPKEPESTRLVMVLEVQDVVGPATSDYIGRALQSAQQQQADLVIIRMDTPGGLDTAMRGIIKSIIASPIPVITYVAPSGARAASAGTYILYASHIAAMAPGTNLGAATPVQLIGAPKGDGGDKEPANKSSEQAGNAMETKAVNDAAAYIRGLAQMRGRNAEWAEKAVREAASLSASEAHELGVIDLVAEDMDELLKQLHGRQLSIQGRELQLNTQGLRLVRLEPDWRSRLLSVIGNPTVAYILMLIGIYGLIYEFANPGAILPGTVGAICLLLALYAFQVLPINYAGMGLILLGLALMVSEAFVPSFGALGIGGVVAFTIGSVILIDTEAPGYGIDLPVIIGLALVSAGILITVASMALKSHRRPVVSGSDALVGALGESIEAFVDTGLVRLHGELWSARTDKQVAKGQRVRVVGRDGLVLQITPERNKEK